MWASLRNVMNTISEKSTGCVKIIYKKLNDPMSSNTNDQKSDNTVSVAGISNPAAYTTLGGGGGGGGWTSWTANTISVAPSNSYTTTYTLPNNAQSWFVGNGTTTSNVDITSNDIKIEGASLKDFMKSVSERLAILQPDLEKLEKFAALREAYEHYKILEALVSNAEPGKDE